MYMLTLLYIILFILFIFYIFNFEDDTDIETPYLKEKKIVNNNSLVNNSSNIIPITNLNANEPQFRGLIDYIKIQDKKENGGSDPFVHNNINIIDTTNEVNYNNYNSYRKKPLQ